MMLVLSRKMGESIQIGTDVTIEVLEVHGNRVRLGITAPNSVGVHRAELLVDVPPTNPATMRAIPSVQRRSLTVPASNCH